MVFFLNPDYAQRMHRTTKKRTMIIASTAQIQTQDAALAVALVARMILLRRMFSPWIKLKY